ncbi:DUF6259 domain-containing protein [Paenibacillus paeoniae]|uniref:DUF6259 domain-containing protein n=1 Tax=Paenibacillus paeoniae TaxID=2292705 RepID=A0A371PFZ4_9BACL|nr:DUF6259 domain-containing protein [Paenibacillus paeoniae]REK74795.1 hypothetical protein DX130_14110 [Paenibacillus paeoniae]
MHTALKNRILLYCFSLVLIILMTGCESKMVFDQSDEHVVKLQNDYFEIAFSKARGEIISIKEQGQEEAVSAGNREGALWKAFLSDGRTISSSDYEHHFNYHWEDKGKRLVLEYEGELAVKVTIEPTEEKAIYMQASVDNRTDRVLQRFSLPHELSIAAESIEDGLVPLMPGALLSRGYFDARQTFSALYPGVMSADYVGVRAAVGRLSVYGIKGDVLQPVQIGFRLSPTDPTQASFIREFRTEAKTTWTSPKVAIRIGEDYPEAITGYRIDNGFDKFDSLQEKLGSKYQAYMESAMYKLDLERVGLTFEELMPQVIDRIDIPGMVHPVAFQQRGHDQNYPDFVPTDERWGTNESFKAFTAYAQQRGNLVAPYTNFSWWDVDSRYVNDLTADELRAMMVSGDDGQPVIEQYGPHRGYVVNPHHEQVKRIIAEQHDVLMKEIGLDGIFEDQWGARTAPLDWNPNRPENLDASTAYFEGVLEHARTHKEHHLMTEVGIDILAEHEVGFMGTNYLWDMSGFRKETAPYTQYYPLMGILARDKVLMYQHDLAAETWTDDKEMFRWNLAQGYLLSGEITGPSSFEINPWLNLIGTFQKYALSRYADELVSSFEPAGDGLTKTDFDTFEVMANWNEKAAAQWGSNVISPGGAAILAKDGSVTGGVFDSYNGKSLDAKEHYILEVRSEDSIKVFQPVGWATNLTISLPSAWKDAHISAYTYADSYIGEVEGKVEGSTITFKYKSLHNQSSVGYYQITKKG